MKLGESISCTGRRSLSYQETPVSATTGRIKIPEVKWRRCLVFKEQEIQAQLTAEFRDSGTMRYFSYYCIYRPISPFNWFAFHVRVRLQRGANITHWIYNLPWSRQISSGVHEQSRKKMARQNDSRIGWLAHQRVPSASKYDWRCRQLVSVGQRTCSRFQPGTF